MSVEAVFNSLTHGIPEDLKQRVRDAMSLLPVRKEILENYVNYVENILDVKVRNLTLVYYLCNHNLEGEKVNGGSKGSLRSFCQYDFANHRGLNKRSSEATLKSLTHGIKDQELIEKVWKYNSMRMAA